MTRLAPASAAEHVEWVHVNPERCQDDRACRECHHSVSDFLVYSHGQTRGRAVK